MQALVDISRKHQSFLIRMSEQMQLRDFVWHCDRARYGVDLVQAAQIQLADPLGQKMQALERVPLLNWSVLKLCKLEIFLRAPRRLIRSFRLPSQVLLSLHSIVPSRSGTQSTERVHFPPQWMEVHPKAMQVCLGRFRTFDHFIIPSLPPISCAPDTRVAETPRILPMQQNMLPDQSQSNKRLGLISHQAFDLGMDTRLALRAHARILRRLYPQSQVNQADDTGVGFIGHLLLVVNSPCLQRTQEPVLSLGALRPPLQMECILRASPVGQSKRLDPHSLMKFLIGSEHCPQLARHQPSSLKLRLLITAHDYSRMTSIRSQDIITTNSSILHVFVLQILFSHLKNACTVEVCNVSLSVEEKSYAKCNSVVMHSRLHESD